jgi:hypothetical protein
MSREVSVGEKSYTIPTFRGYKGMLAGTIVSGALNETEQVLTAVNAYERTYSENNPKKITRQHALARVSFGADLKLELERTLSNEDVLRAQVEEANPEAWATGDEDVRRQLVESTRTELMFRLGLVGDVVQTYTQTLEEMGDRDWIEYPGEARPWQSRAVGFVKANEVAPNTVRQLLGLIVISNRDLEKFDEEAEGDSDKILGELEKLGREVLFAGELEEIVDLLAEGSEVIYTQLEKMEVAWGKLGGLLDRVRGRQEQAQEQATEETTDEEPAEPSSSTSDSEPSSTSSPPPSTGSDEPSSTEPRGASSSSSPVA